jgi:hypothetical protein
MPTSTEHGNLSYDTHMTSTSTFSVGDSEDNRAGKYIFDKTSNKTIYGIFATTDPTGSYVLPASGHRDNSNGSLSFVGNVGHYWSGSSAFSSSFAYELSVYSSDASANGYTGRSYGQPVRCVLQE